jgi:hypothetical protein
MCCKSTALFRRVQEVEADFPHLFRIFSASFGVSSPHFRRILGASFPHQMKKNDEGVAYTTK